MTRRKQRKLNEKRHIAFVNVFARYTYRTTDLYVDNPEIHLVFGIESIKEELHRRLVIEHGSILNGFVIEFINRNLPEILTEHKRLHDLPPTHPNCKSVINYE